MSDPDAGFEYRATIQFAAEPWTVFEALTQPETLSRWFAEHVDLQPRVGGCFGFWGKHTYGVPAPLEAHQKITHFDPPRAFAFDWEWLNSSGHVQFALSEKDSGTQLELSHRFEHLPAQLRHRDPEESKGIIDAFWKLSMSNLRQYLRSGAPAMLPDYTDVEDRVELSIVIHAPPESVYQALLDPEALDGWMATGARVDPRVGGVYDYGWSDRKGGPARIVALEPSRLLVTDWSWEGEPPTRVRWQLDPCPEGTRVTLTHSGFAGDPAAHHYALGWCGFMILLKKFTERRLK